MQGGEFISLPAQELLAEASTFSEIWPCYAVRPFQIIKCPAVAFA